MTGRLPERERKNKEMIDERKNVQTNPTRTYCKHTVGAAMVLGVLLIWLNVMQGPTALAVGAGGGLFGQFYTHLSFLSSFSLLFPFGRRPDID